MCVKLVLPVIHADVDEPVWSSDTEQLTMTSAYQLHYFCFYASLLGVCRQIYIFACKIFLGITFMLPKR